MILAGLMSLVQVCWLPGFLLIRLFPARGVLARVLIGFALSLLVNYEVVFLLAAVGLYRRPVVLGLFALELIGAVWIIIARPRRAGAGASIAETEWSEEIADWPRALPLRHLLIMATALTVLWLTRFWLPKIPGIFNLWDDMTSWNVWAVEWAHNELPQWCRSYPQLMPANWSLTYIFTNQTLVEFFAKGFMGLFTVGVVLLFLPLARVTRSLAVVFAGCVCGYLMLFLYGGLIGEGFADIPEAYLTLSAFLALQLGWEGEMPAARAVVLTALLAAAAAVTKQAGLYTLVAAFGGCGLLMARARLPRTQALALVGVIAGIAVIGVAPWYAREAVLLAQGRNQSELKYQTSDLYQGRPPLARIPKATADLAGRLLRGKDSASAPMTGALVAAFAVMAIFAWRRRIGRWALIFGVPYYFLWGAFFSYDERNLALAIPFYALIVAVGGFELAQRLYSICAAAAPALMPQTRFIPLILIAALVPAGIWADRRWPAQMLYARQDAMLRRAGVGGEQLTELLYQYARSPGFHAAILTNYEVLGVLPNLGRYYRHYRFNIGDNLDPLRARLAETEDPVGYLLVPDYAAENVRQYIAAHEHKVFHSDEWTLYEVGAPAKGAASP